MRILAYSSPRFPANINDNIRYKAVYCQSWDLTCVCVCVCVCVCMHAQSHLTLCNSMDCRPPCSSIRDGGLVTKSCPTLVTPWTVACQAPLSMGFSSQEHWSGLPFPSPGDLLDSGAKPGCPALEADSLLTELQGKSHGVQCYSFR